MQGRIEIDETGLTIVHPDREEAPVECIYPQGNNTGIHVCIPPYVDAQIVWHY